MIWRLTLLPALLAFCSSAAGLPKPGLVNPCPDHILARLHDVSEALALEVTPGNLTLIQERNREIFSQKVIPLMARVNAYHSLPKGIRADLQKPFEALFKLTRDGNQVFNLLQRLERRVVEYSATYGISLEESFECVLRLEELRFGFEQPKIVTTFLDQEPFLDLLARGVPIADEYWFNKPHSENGHRVQSIIEAYYIEEEFGQTGLYLQLYKEMGNRHALANDWKWEETGINMANIDPLNSRTLPDVWAILHDTPFFAHAPHNLIGDQMPQDFTNPEFFADLRPLLPGLRGWK